jgi:Zn-dependent M28 family amino/carboxypeptidase
VKWALVVVAVAACGGARSRSAPAPDAAPLIAPVDRTEAVLEKLDEKQLMADVAWLTAPALKGRGSLSAEARLTADRVAEELEGAGLEVERLAIGTTGQDNVMGILRGTDEVIIVCAHYDHVGDVGGAIHWGADDNASGMAALLALARAVGKTHRGRTIVFLSTGAEEEGLVGSLAFVRTPPFPLTRVKAVLNFDMVGRNLLEAMAEDQKGLAVVGMEDDAELEQAFLDAAKVEAANLVPVSVNLAKMFRFDWRSDAWPFRRAGIPSVHISTGMHLDYHQPSDTADKIRPDQLLRVTRVTARVLVTLGRLELRAP